VVLIMLVVYFGLLFFLRFRCLLLLIDKARAIYRESTRTVWFVYLQLNKKKAKAEGKKCHAKTMWSQ
jgi:hypothetical protein